MDLLNVVRKIIQKKIHINLLTKKGKGKTSVLLFDFQKNEKIISGIPHEKNDFINDEKKDLV